MKQILPILALAVTLGACKAKVSETENMNSNMVLVDTTGLYKSNVLTDVGNNKFVINTTPVEAEPVRTVRKPVRKAAANNNSSNTVYSSGTSTSTNAALPQKEKGWSDAAKGAAIGGGAGAILGAIVSKNNRAAGAIIGGVAGAGGGYAIGRANDRKSGRVERAKQRKEATSY